MPGAKRKFDEDTWMGTQSKKFKCGLLIANVYASTLAQLRMGARNFFNNTTAAGSHQDQRNNQIQNVVNFNESPASPQSPGSRSTSPFHSPPASPLMRDVLSDNDDSNVNQIQRPQELCFNCSSKREEGWEKCYYCEKVVCHLNLCEGGCNEGYCSNCCITKYDNPSGETYVCYGCRH